MKIIKIIPRSYCHGVVEAINSAIETILNTNTKQPIHLLGELVHNKNINNVFKSCGVIIHESKHKTRLELLDEIEDGDGTVILTAHGVSDIVLEKAKTKKLEIVNAICSDVTRTFNLIKERIKHGYDIIYIGKLHHPESVAACELNRKHIHFVQTTEDALKLTLNNKKIVITNQTTLSLWDVAKVSDVILQKYPFAIYEREICDATQTRQQAVVDAASNVDLIIIVGDPRSNNSNKLVEVSKKIANTNAILIEDVSQLFNYNFSNVNSVGISAGASTPPLLVKDVVQFLENPNNFNKKHYVINNHKLIPKLSSKIQNID